MALHHSPGINEPDYRLIGSEEKGVMMASYQPNADEMDSAPYTNVVIASFTTAQARLQLLEVLETAGSDALYCDTDSLFYLTRDNFDCLAAKTGAYLGFLTNELEQYGEGSYIDQFCAGGPKNYSYRVCGGAVGIKTKGITITAGCRDTVTHETLRRMVLEGGSVKITGRQIRRTEDLSLVTVDSSKVWQTCYTKRRLVNRFYTLPFGYVD